MGWQIEIPPAILVASPRQENLLWVAGASGAVMHVLDPEALLSECPAAEGRGAAKTRKAPTFISSSHVFDDVLSLATHSHRRRQAAGWQAAINRPFARSMSHPEACVWV
jgi:hypothetical protein